MKPLKLIVLWSLTAVLCSCNINASTQHPSAIDSTQTPSGKITADIIFLNGNILTMDTDKPSASAIAIKAEHILAIGKGREVLLYQGSETKVIDLHGQTLMPGFVDAHDHLFDNAFLNGKNPVLEEQLAIQNGLTTIADLYVDEGILRNMQALSDSGKLKIRTNLYLVYDTNCGTLNGD